MIEAIVSSLLSALANPAAAAFSLLWGLEADKQKLREELELITAALEGAEEKQYREEPVRIWLQQFKGVTYDAVDVLDELSMVAAVHPRLLTEADAAVTNRSVRLVSTCFLSCFSDTPNPLVFRHQMGSRIQNIMARLTRIIERASLLGLTGERKQLEPYPTRETSFLPKRDQLLLGRYIQKQQLIQVLCADNDDRVPLIVPIVGIGGIGKTTLAQEVYSDSIIQGQFPQMRKWVFGGEKFDARKIIEELLSEEAPKQKIVGKSPTLNSLHELLKRKIEDIRFLIVLDDVWTEEEEEWDQLWRPLEHGGKGSRVIVTTRSPQVAKMRGTVPSTIKLEPLSSEECWSIFEKCAFIDKSSEEYPEMQVIGWEIVKKLRGIPLAAKLIGEALGRNFRKTYWGGLLESEIWLQELDKGSFLPSLLLSYHALPPHLKPCFALCSLFPKCHRFDPETLVWMWMAHDFILPVGSGRMEDVGRRCFDELLQRSFFQYVDVDDDQVYVMHDVIHDLAEFVSREECLRVEDDKKPCSKPDNVHHISLHFDDDHVLEPIYLNQFNRARTVIGLTEELTVASDQNFCRLLGRLKSIRVLDLQFCKFLESLPEDINNLKHLRYLDIRDTGVRKLPESLCMVYHLQTLMVDAECALPKGMSRLVNLRHLQAYSDYISEIAGIGKLTCLQELKGPFRVLSEDVKQGRNIRELRGMNQLGGTLRIENLEKVGSAEEAEQARLRDKVFLQGLELVYGRDVFENQEAIYERVMEALQPPRQIKELTLFCYPGSQPPNWMTGDARLLSNLQHLWIQECPNLQSLTTSLPPTLRYLSIRECPNLQSLPTSLPPTLEDLFIQECPNLQSLPTSLPPALRRLDIEKCPNLQSLPTSLPPTLQHLSIKQCPNLQSLPASLPPTLEILVIKECPNLQSLSTNLPPTLQQFRIKECPNLHSLPTRLPPTLKNLRIQKCPNLQSLPTSLPPTLQQLCIQECPNLRSFPTSLPHTLQELRIELCPNLQSLPTSLPPTLKYFLLKRCLNLLSLPTSLPPTLQTLSIEECPNLQALLSIPPSLWRLELLRCPRLEEVTWLEVSSSTAPVGFHKLATDNRRFLSWLLLQPRSLDSLRHLEIKDCVDLETFTEEEKEGWRRNLPSLSSLSFGGCPNLLSLPEGLPVEPEIWDCPKFQPPPRHPPCLPTFFRRWRNRL